jgi:cation transport ATPase
LPECAANIATISTNLLQVTETQKHIAETVFGNGKTGLDEQTKENTREIQGLIKVISDMAEEKKAELEERKKEAEERKRDAGRRSNDIRKWWLGIFGALILAIIAIAQNIAIAAALNNLDKLIPSIAK